MGRLVKLGALGLRAGAGLLQSSKNEGAAKFAAESLSRMRGIASKVGQMAAYIDGIVPENQREQYQGWLKGLLDQTTASPFSDVRAIIEADTGVALEKSFVEFDEAPIASASIGQVHRARLLDGREVAVKVQHPGIADAVASDLKNAGLLESALAIAGTRKFESKRVLEEIRARFSEELDYKLEASRQRAFATLNADTPAVLVPMLVDSLCTSRMLTMEFVRGVGLETLVTRSEDERRHAAETMWRFVYHTSLKHGLFNADPHPGNFIFLDDGRVAFLDFGCVQTSAPDRCEMAMSLHRAAVAGDEKAVRDIGRVMLQTRGGRFEQLALDYHRAALRPEMESPFRITRAYVAGLVQQFRDSGIEAAKSRGDDVVPMPEGIFFMNRLQFGFFSVLARLDVTVDYAAIERSFL